MEEEADGVTVVGEGIVAICSCVCAVVCIVL